MSLITRKERKEKGCNCTFLFLVCLYLLVSFRTMVSEKKKMEKKKKISFGEMWECFLLRGLVIELLSSDMISSEQAALAVCEEQLQGVPIIHHNRVH